LNAELLRSVPDLPRWVETRALLLTGRAELFGVCEDDRGWNFIALCRASGLASIVGTPPPDSVAQALSSAREMISPTGYPLHSPAWHGERAFLHTLAHRVRPEPKPGAEAALFPAASCGPNIPQDLADELREAANYSPIVATLFHGEPVAFCYGVPTESLWDVSVDTLEPYRGRGFAALCADLMIDIMGEAGKSPVWGALESNIASLRLAAKLGFAPVDEIVVYTRCS
jgi:GNAT superfamily N-acetyltransferase